MLKKSQIKNTISIAISFVMLSSSPFLGINHLYAETLESTNYKIDGAVISGSGDVVDSGSGTYSLFTTIGDFSGNPRTTSTTYELRPGNPDVFTAATPVVTCFETTTSGSSDCTTGPSYLNSYGMVRVCGSEGCYNKARFEIDTQGNPADTLYGVQISTDNFVSDLMVIDGVTLKPKPFASRQLTDYLTKTEWETEVFNILGLQSYTQYYIRLTTLHGDFTESTPGPIVSATTANATIEFDIDITDIAETDPETAPPYTIAFTGTYTLFAGGTLQIPGDLIWLDVESNAEGGIAIIQNGLYGGLDSSTETYTITSATADLETTPDGFGIQNYDYSGTETYQEDYSGSGGSDLGSITVASDYNNSGQTVGIVSTNAISVYSSSGPIDLGRTALFLKARASTSVPPANDYTETITFVAVGRY